MPGGRGRGQIPRHCAVLSAVSRLSLLSDFQSFVSGTDLSALSALALDMSPQLAPWLHAR